jgi:spore coat protein A, manganese oxidase
MARTVAVLSAVLSPACFLFFSRIASASVLVPQTPLPGVEIRQFIEPLPTPPEIDATGAYAAYTITMSEFQQKVLPEDFYAPLPSPFDAGTFVWGYNGSYPGPSIITRRGFPVTATYINNIANSTPTEPAFLQRYLTVDQTLHWADPLGCMADPSCDPTAPYLGPVPATVHLHGGEVPSAFDGGPDSWFTPTGLTGPGFVSNVYFYPNEQEPTSLFYHDHALGTTRLNVYSGLAGFYFVNGTPGFDEPLRLPSQAYTRALAIQDRMFDTNGQLFFPDVGDNPDIHPFWQPEFFGDAIVVNGKTWPFLEVEPRRYRFHVLNGSNARFYSLRIQGEEMGAGPKLWQIGSDGGYLNAPVRMDEITLAPGERADIIVDFRRFAGRTLLLRNSARAPFPGGDPPDPMTTGRIMQFRVKRPLATRDRSCNPAARGCVRPVRIVDLRSTITRATPVRRLTLNEVMGPGGPLAVLLNNSMWDAPVTEDPRVGATEVWEIANLTADTHPIHIHLVQFQLLNRQAFRVDQYLDAYNAAFPMSTYDPFSGPPLPYGDCNSLCDRSSFSPVCGGNVGFAPFLQGAPVPPDPNEAGWKDTFRMNPGEVTRIVVRWAPQDARRSAPGVNQYPFDPTAMLGTIDAFGLPGGPGYVWHCHIIDHEDNEMMRPYQVQP